jgi:hypothetical protein
VSGQLGMSPIGIDDVIPPLFAEHHGPPVRVAQLDIGHRPKIAVPGATVAR